jgi:hypothetical protein
MIHISSPVDIIKKSIQVFVQKKNFIYLISIYLPLLPFSLFSFFQTYFPDSLLNSFRGAPLLVVAINIAYLITFFWVSISGVLGVDGIISGQTLEFKQLYKKAWKMVGKYLVLSLLIGILVFAGGLLLIVPGILFLVWFSFARFELILGNLGIFVSLKRSKELVSGRFWKIFGRLLVFLLFAALVQLIVVIPYIGPVVSPLLGALYIIPNYFLYRELLNRV